MRRVKADQLREEAAALSVADLFKELPHAPGVFFLKGRGRPDVVEYVRRCVDLGLSLPEEVNPGVATEAAQSDLFMRSRPAAAAPPSEFAYVVTGSLIEAELLELDLIRHYRPERNLRSETPREAVYLHVETSKPFPVFEISRRFPQAGVTGFGPFFEPEKLRRGLEVARRMLRLRYCGDVFPPPGHERCIRLQRDHCAGPCRGTITPAVYRSRLDRLVMFLRGDDDRLLEDLRRTYQSLRPEEVAEFDEGARDLLAIQRGLLEMSEPAQSARLVVSTPGESGRTTVVLFRRGRIITRFRTRRASASVPTIARRMQSSLLTHRADPVGLLNPEELAASAVVRRHIHSPEPGERVYRVTNLSELPKLVELALREVETARTVSSRV